MLRAGWAPEDIDQDVSVDLWPDVWESWLFYASLSSQWRDGMNGRYALDLTPFLMVMQINGWSAEKCADMLSDLRAIEAAALAARQS